MEVVTDATPASETPVDRSTRPARIRRERSLVESLLSITLGLEAAMMFFAALVLFGMNRFDPQWLGLVYGAAFIVVLLLVSRVQRWTWGVVVGAVLQLALILTGLIEPMMYLVGAVFTALWIYCFVKGRQVDRKKVAWLAAQASGDAPADTDTPATPATPDQGDTP